MYVLWYFSRTDSNDYGDLDSNTYETYEEAKEAKVKGEHEYPHLRIFIQEC